MTKKKKGTKLQLRKRSVLRLSEKHLSAVAGGVCYVESVAPTDNCPVPSDACPPPPDPPDPASIKHGNTSKFNQTGGANHNQAVRHR